MPPIFPSFPFDPSPHRGVSTPHSFLNEPLEDEMLLDHQCRLEPASPQLPLHFPFADIFHEPPQHQAEGEERWWLDNYPDRPDQEFLDLEDDQTQEIMREYPLHHLTYVSYPMRAVDVLRHDLLNPQSNEYLRPGTQNGKGLATSQYWPDGLRLIFVGWLKKYDGYGTTGVSVGLWRTQGEEEDPMLVVVKRIKGYRTQGLVDEVGDKLGTLRIPYRGLLTPGEVRFIDLPDDTKRTIGGGFRFLYNPLLTCMPQTHAFQLHDTPQDMQNVTHFGKYYNGGKVEDLIDKYKEMGRAVPEPLIWHVIAQLGRAYKFIHTGRTMPDKTARRGSPRGPPKRGQEEEEWMRKEEERASRWTPTAHWDGHAANVWFHFVTGYERDHDVDSCLTHFDDCFPQVILGDFGLAMNRLDGGVSSYALNLDDCPDLPDRETWKDKAEFGLVLVHLLLAGRQNVPRFTSQPFKKDWADRYGYWLGDNYSEELVNVVRRFSFVASLSDTNRHYQTWFYQLIQQEYTRWKDDGWNLRLAPDNSWFHNGMIDLADKKVHEARTLRRRMGNESLRELMGQRMSTMPYQVPNRTKYSRMTQHSNAWNLPPQQQEVAIPLSGRETLRSKARTIYNRKMRRPVTAAYFRHPPDPVDRVDRDKLWVSKTYRLERIRYRRPLNITIESTFQGDCVEPPSPDETISVEGYMFKDGDIWDEENQLLRLDMDGDQDMGGADQNEE